MSERDALQATLTEILELLIAHGDRYVVDRLQAYRLKLQAGDDGVVNTLRYEANGGMGSLRDRYLCAMNGDRITPEEQESVNARLGELVERLAQQTLPAHNSDARA